MILIDLQKALDIPDHKIFLEKMTYTGFKILIINWFESYLSNKKLFVSVDDFFSETGILNWGVPQGSILRPLLGQLLFLIYYNDLPQSLSESGYYLYADDICIFFQDKDVHKIEDALIKEFSTFREWFVDKSLSIHFMEDKTKCILFSKTKRSSKLSISYGDHVFKQYHTVKYLVCYLTTDLWQWKF